MDTKRFIIIGAGSIGLLFAAKLALDHHNVTCIISPRLHNKFPTEMHFIETNGIKIDLCRILVIKTEADMELLHKSFDYLIIASKATHLPQICRDYQSLIDHFSAIFLLQNGLGNEEIVQSAFPTKNILRIVTSHGSMLTENGFKHTGVGPTSICLLKPIKSVVDNQSSLKLGQIFTHAGIECEWSNNPHETIWRKAFINISINVFGALTRLVNGDLPNIDGLMEYIEKTFNEAYLIAKQQNINLFPQETYLEAIRFVLKNAGRNKNSMLQDIMAGKLTEIDFLNGRIVQYGKMFQIPTPYNQFLTVLIKGLEKSLKK